MSDEFVPQTDAELLPILREFAEREPIFHRPKFAATLADFDNMMADDYWEFGAPGQLYTRDFILDVLEIPPIDAAEAGWKTLDFHCRRLAPDTFLLTYTLHQNDRQTRRATIWKRTPSDWQILFHQGTLIQDT
jgi:hypothetical protein